VGRPGYRSRSGRIVAQVLTDSKVDDARTGLDLIEQVEGKVACITADPAYDTIAIYDAVLVRGARL